MLKGTILRAIFFWIVILIVIQPLLSHTDFLLDLNVKGNASLLAQKAAPEGKVTPELYDEIIQNLMMVGLTEDQIDIQFESQIHERTEIIEVTIIVERNPMFVINLGVTTPQYYVGHHQVMSEYLD